MTNDDNFEDLDRGPQEEDKLEIGWQILSFCIPIAGAVLYFINKDKFPNKAKTACYAALIGVGVSIVLNIVAGLTMGSMM